MSAAALIFLAASVLIFAPGVVRILRGDAIDRLLVEPLDGPDYDAGIAAFDSMPKEYTR